MILQVFKNLQSLFYKKVTASFITKKINIILILRELKSTTPLVGLLKWTRIKSREKS